jgi:hypothetical protein
MNALIEMTTLFFNRPAPGAELHARLAEAGGPDAEQEQAYATASYARASKLTAA